MDSLLSVAATFLYFEQAAIVAAASDDPAVRTRIFAAVDLVWLMTCPMRFTAVMSTSLVDPQLDSASVEVDGDASPGPAAVSPEDETAIVTLGVQEEGRKRRRLLIDEG